MRCAVPVAALLVLLAGCSGPSQEPEVAPSEPRLVSTPDDEAITFSGMDHPYLCPPAGPVCVVNGPNPSKTYEFLLDNGTSLAGLTLTVDAVTVNDQRRFTVAAYCGDNGNASCGKGLSLLDEAEGPLPLTLDATGLDVPRGVRILVTVQGTELAPNVANTMQVYSGTGTLHVLRWTETAQRDESLAPKALKACGPVRPPCQASWDK